DRLGAELGAFVETREAFQLVDPPAWLLEAVRVVLAADEGQPLDLEWRVGVADAIDEYVPSGLKHVRDVIGSVDVRVLEVAQHLGSRIARQLHRDFTAVRRGDRELSVSVPVVFCDVPGNGLRIWVHGGIGHDLPRSSYRDICRWISCSMSVRANRWQCIAVRPVTRSPSTTTSWSTYSAPMFLTSPIRLL